MPRAAITKVVFSGDVIQKIVTDARVTWKSKYLTRKTSSIQWLNAEVNRQGFTGFTAETFYNNAWQQIWEQGTLPPSYSRLAPDQQTKLNVYLTITNEIVMDALGIDPATGQAVAAQIAHKKPDLILKSSGLRAWIIAKRKDDKEVRIKLENGSISDWLTIEEYKAVR